MQTTQLVSRSACRVPPRGLSASLRVLFFAALAVLLPLSSYAQYVYASAIHPTGGYWLVKKIDPVTGSEILQVADPTSSNQPVAMALTPDESQLYFVSSGNLVAIDTSTGSVTPISLSNGAGPRDLVVSPDGASVYVSACNLNCNGTYTIKVISTATNTQTNSITLPNVGHAISSGGHAMAISPSGGEIYIARFNAAGPTSYITVYDVSAGTFSSITGASISNGILGLAVTPDGSRLYAISGDVAVFDTSSKAVVTTITANVPAVMAITPGGNKLYVVSLNEPSCPTSTAGTCLIVIDTATNSILKKVNGAVSSAGLTATPDGSSVVGFGFDIRVVSTVSDTVVATHSGYSNFSFQVSITSRPSWSGVTTSPISALKTLGICFPSCGDTQANSSSRSPATPPGQLTAGDPITVSSGNLFEAVTDYQTLGQNPLSFIRYYNSQAPSGTYATTLAANWRSNYDRYLRVVSSTLVKAERHDGKVINFALVGGNWVTDSDVDAALDNPSGSTWTLTTSDDTVESYTVTSGKGVLDSIAYRNGYTQTLTYSSGLLSDVTDSYSRSLNFTYSSGRLDTLTTPDTPTFSYGYTSAGGSFVLTSITYTNLSPTKQQSYAYTASGLPFALTSITDENGVAWNTWTYDSFGRATSSKVGTGANAELTAVSYDSATQRTVTNALSQPEVYTFGYLQGVPKLTQISRTATGTTAAAARTFTYDSNGYLASETDWNGNQTDYTNDTKGQPTLITEAVGQAEERDTAITYHSTFRVPTQIVKAGLTANFTHDSDGNVLTRAFTDGTNTRTWTYTYNGTGLVLTEQNPRSKTTTYTYHGDGSIDTITNAAGHVTDVISHTTGGRPTQILYPDGTRAWPVYDGRLRVEDITTSWTPWPVTTYFTYDDAGNLLTVTPPDMQAQTFTYDTAHRLTKIEDSSGNSITYTLNAMGNRTATVIKNAGLTTTRQNAATFDALGRMLTYTGGASQVTSYAYDDNGNATSITDGRSNAATQAFDALDRLVSVTKNSVTTTTTYDEADRPLVVTAPGSIATTYNYNVFGDVTSIVSPDTGTTTFNSHDANGNVTQQTDARSIVTNFTYDDIDRMLTKQFPGNTSENVSYTYDQGGHGFGVGRLTTMADAAGSLSRSYNEKGQITSDARTNGGTTYTTSYGYYGNGALASITYPSGMKINYTRDYDMLPVNAKLTPPGGGTQVNVISNMANFAFGPFRFMVFGNSSQEWPLRDLDYRITTLFDVNSTNTGYFQYLGLTYDGNDNITAIDDQLANSNDQTLTYDVLDRMLTATSGTGGYGAYTWTYDGNGNRLSQAISGGTTTNYTYTSNSNRLATIDTGTPQNVTTDAAGNITVLPSNSGTSATVTWLHGGTPSQITGTSLAATYVYDGFNQRFSRTAGGTTDYFIYGQGGELLERSHGATVINYIYVDGRPVGIYMPGTNTRYYIHSDHLGKPEAVTDQSQAIVWNANYKPFGETLTFASSIIEDLRFPGQSIDGEALFHHNGFREYVPQIGRYLSSDPIGLAGGMNTYAYVGSNPMARTDPRGLEPFPDFADLTGELNPACYGRFCPIEIPPPTVAPSPATVLHATAGTLGLFAAGSMIHPATRPLMPAFRGLAACFEAEAQILEPNLPGQAKDKLNKMIADQLSHKVPGPLRPIYSWSIRKILGNYKPEDAQ